MTPLEQYIRRAAAIRGIDPNIAVRVASSEGGLHNPFRHGEGPAPKSQAPGFGPTENSYGPFQLYISGTNAGLGDKALAAGVDPRKDWKSGVNFALDQAKSGGWGPWYGAKAAGITGMTGIGSAPVQLSPEAQNFVNNNPQPGGYGPGISDPNAPPSFGSMAPASPMMARAGIPADVASYATSNDKEKSPLQKLGDALMKYPDAPRPNTQFTGGATNGDALLKFMQQPNALSQMFLKKRLGLS